MRWLVLAIVAAPALTYGVYRVAKGLGFLDPPWNREHEYRRTIVVAMYAFLIFLPVFLFGYANAWPRVWAMFGLVNALALLVFAALGGVAAWRLWKLRHPTSAPVPAVPVESVVSAATEPSEKPLI